MTLWELVADESYVDLLHIDIQGLELDVLDSASRLVDQRVKRLYVGTHSREIEDGLRRLLSGLGWQCLNDNACSSVAATPYGEISFQDGMRSWVNPAGRVTATG
jgi:hypothetical protein